MSRRYTVLRSSSPQEHNTCQSASPLGVLSRTAHRRHILFSYTAEDSGGVRVAGSVTSASSRFRTVRTQIVSSSWRWLVDSPARTGSRSADGDACSDEVRSPPHTHAHRFYTSKHLLIPSPPSHKYCSVSQHQPVGCLLGCVRTQKYLRRWGGGRFRAALCKVVNGRSLIDSSGALAPQPSAEPLVWCGPQPHADSFLAVPPATT